jgi:hypothetical protein
MVVVASAEPGAPLVCCWARAVIAARVDNVHPKSTPREAAPTIKVGSTVRRDYLRDPLHTWRLPRPLAPRVGSKAARSSASRAASPNKSGHLEQGSQLASLSAPGDLFWI